MISDFGDTEILYSQSQISKAVMANKELQDQLQKKIVECQTFKIQLIEAQENLASQGVEKNQLTTQFEMHTMMLTKQVIERNIQYTQTEKILTEQRKRELAIKEEYKQQENKSKKIIDSYNSLQEKLQSLSGELEDLKDKNKEYHQRILDGDVRYQELMEQLNSEKAKGGLELENIEEQNRKKLKLKDKTIAELENTIKDRQQRLIETRDKNHLLKSQLHAENQEKKSLKEEINNLRSQTKELVSSKDQLINLKANEISQLMNQLDQQFKEKQNCLSELSQKIQEYNEIYKENRDLKNSIFQLEAEKLEIGKYLQSKDVTIAELQNSVKQVQQTSQSLQIQHQELMSQLQELRNTNQIQERNSQEQLNQIQALSQKYEHAEGQLKKAQQSNEMLIQELEGLKQEAGQKQREIDTISKQNQSLLQKIDTLKTVERNLWCKDDSTNKEEIQTLVKQLQDQFDKISDLEMIAKIYQDESQNLIKQLEAEKKKNQELNVKNNKKKEKGEKQKNFEQQMQQLQGDNSVLSRKHTELSNLFAEKENNILQLQKVFEEQNDIISVLKIEKKQKEQELEHQRANYQSMQANFEDLTNQFNEQQLISQKNIQTINQQQEQMEQKTRLTQEQYQQLFEVQQENQQLKEKYYILVDKNKLLENDLRENVDNHLSQSIVLDQKLQEEVRQQKDILSFQDFILQLKDPEIFYDFMSEKLKGFQEQQKAPEVKGIVVQLKRLVESFDEKQLQQ